MTDQLTDQPPPEQGSKEWFAMRKTQSDRDIGWNPETKSYDNGSPDPPTKAQGLKDIIARAREAVEECEANPELAHLVSIIKQTRDDEITRFIKPAPVEWPEPEPSQNGTEPTPTETATSSQGIQRHPTATGFEDAELSTWRDIDLTEAIKGDRSKLLPQWFTRDDNARLIYPGCIHWFYGESESYKSLTAQLAVAMVLDEGGNAIYFDFEDSEYSVVSRLQAFGVPDEVTADRTRFRYVHPEESTDLQEVHQHMTDVEWSVAIIDGVTEAMTNDGLNYIKNDEIAKWLRILNRIITPYGCATINVDHVVKNAEARDGQPMGGVTKRNATIVQVEFKLIDRLHRATMADQEGRTGRVSLHIRKDRIGWVSINESSNDRCWAMMEFTSWPDEKMTYRVLPPIIDQSILPNDRDIQRVFEVVKLYDGVGTTQLRTDSGIKTDKTTLVIRWAVNEEMMTITKVGTKSSHSLTDKGNEYLRILLGS